jgi:outer membrane protein assembly factor BamB
MRIARLRLPLLIAALALQTSALCAENWPMWRGPRGDGTSGEAKLPTEWDGARGEHIAWKVELPGRGHASPIVWGDRVFVVGCDLETKERLLLCLDRETGRTLWRKSVLRAPLERKHALNSFASSTPATDGKYVYVSFLETSPLPANGKPRAAGKMVVAAYTMEGEQAWIVRPGPFSSIHGYCSSPVLFEDLVIVNGDHDGDAYLVALDRATGATRWKTARENRVRSYCTPIIRQIDGRAQMILSGSECVASYDPRTGERHWIIDGPTEQFVASPVYNGELVFVTAGFPEHHMLAIRPDGRGNVTDTNIAWRTTKGCSYVPSPIAVGPYFLITSDGGVGSCFVADTGERLWMKRMGRHYSASPIAAAGLVYFTDDDGTTKIVRPGEKYEVVAENQLGERCFASPAASRRQLFFRGEKHLFCIR